MTRKDYIKLKCDLLINGLRLDDLRKDLVREKDWTEERAAKFLPAELKLPQEVYCQIRESSEANFRLRVIENNLVIQDRRNAIITSADFVPFPPISNESAGDGTPFSKIVVYNG